MYPCIHLCAGGDLAQAGVGVGAGGAGRALGAGRARRVERPAYQVTWGQECDDDRQT